MSTKSTLSKAVQQMGGGIYSAEEYEGEAEVGTGGLVDEAGEAIDTGGSAQAIITEIVEAQQEAETAVTKLAEIHEEVESLEKFSLALEQHKERGLSPDGAIMLNIAFEGFKTRMEIDPSLEVVPTVEQFGGSAGAISSTIVAMEAADGFVSAGINKAKELFKRIVAFFKNLWIKLTNGAPRIEARAKALIKTLESVKGNPKSATFESGLASSLGTGVEKVTAASVKGSLEILKALADESHLNNIPDLAKNAAAGKKTKEFAKATATAWDNLGKGAKTTPENKRFGSGFSAYASPIIAGNKRFYVAQSTRAFAEAEAAEEGSLKGINANIEVYGRSRVGFFTVDSKIKAKELEVLNRSDAESICDDVIKLASEVTNYKTKWASREASIEAAVEAIKPGKGDKDEAAKIQAADIKLLQTVYSNLNRVSTGICAEALSLSNKALDYVAASLKQYGEKEKDAK